MWRIGTPRPLGMKFAGNFVQIKRNSMWFMGACGGLNQARKLRNATDQRQFSRIVEPMQLGPRQCIAPGGGVLRQVRQHIAGIAKDRLSAGMTVLHVKHRIFARLLDDLGEVEIERGIVLAVQHHEPDGVAPDFADDIARQHEIAGAFRHFDRLAGAQKSYELDELYIEIGLAVRNRAEPPPAYA